MGLAGTQTETIAESEVSPAMAMATDAMNAANAAQSDADAAQTSANTAQSTATSAQSTANTAQTTAGNTYTNNITATSNSTVSIPAGYCILRAYLHNTTGNALLGTGLRIGTTNGGVDVVVALAVTANAFAEIPLLKTGFSVSAAQTLYIQSILGWNSASLNIYFVLRKFTV